MTARRAAPAVAPAWWAGVAAVVCVLVSLHATGASGQVENGLQRAANGLAYRLSGQGDAVVFIHGSNLDHRSWLDEAALVAEDHTVVLYDLRAHGASAPASMPYSNADDLAEVLDELDLGPVTLVGLSAGSQVALDFALTYPDRVRAMVLAAPIIGGYVPAETPDFFAALMSAIQDGDFARANAVLLASPVMRVDDRFENRVRTMVEGNEALWGSDPSLQRLLDPPAIGRLAELTIPILVLVGSDDLAAIKAQAAILERELKMGRVVELDRGGHLVNLTRPELFRQELLRFLKEGR